MDWAWTTGTDLIMNIDKANLVDGIWIFNIGISIPGVGGAITITDKKSGTWEVYKNPNSTAGNLIAPFSYFTKGNNLSFQSSVACTYGFNYITISRDK